MTLAWHSIYMRLRCFLSTAANTHAPAQTFDDARKDGSNVRGCAAFCSEANVKFK